MILDSGTIRFSNLHYVDDPLEKYVKVKKYTADNKRIENVRKDFGVFCFVSCWTRQRDESISMWDMYGNKKGGVRIALPDSPLLEQEQYKSDNPTKVKRLIHIEPVKISPEIIDIHYDRKDDLMLVTDAYEPDYDKLGKYKIKEWEFQDERRFRIFALRSENGILFCNAKGMNAGANGSLLEKSYIDWPINPNALKQMEIVVGPNMRQGQRVLLYALAEKYSIETSRISISKLPSNIE